MIHEKKVNKIFIDSIVDYANVSNKLKNEENVFINIDGEKNEIDRSLYFRDSDSHFSQTEDIFFKESNRSKNLLDINSGTCSHVDYLSKRKITGLEKSQKFIDLSLNKKGLILNESLIGFNTHKKYDTITFFTESLISESNILGYFSNTKNLNKNIKKALSLLSPGGKILISVFMSDKKEGKKITMEYKGQTTNETNLYHITLEEFRKLLNSTHNADLNILASEEVCLKDKISMYCLEIKQKK